MVKASVQTEHSNLFNQQYEGKLKFETFLVTCEKLCFWKNIIKYNKSKTYTNASYPVVGKIVISLI